MRGVLLSIGILLMAGCSACAAQLQGVIADWGCTRDMVEHGREATLKQRPDCSLVKNYSKAEYGLITDDKKFYKLDDAGNKQARSLLGNTRDRDNLRVVVTGDLDGNTIKVASMSLL